MVIIVLFCNKAENLFLRTENPCVAGSIPALATKYESTKPRESEAFCFSATLSEDPGGACLRIGFVNMV